MDLGRVLMLEDSSKVYEVLGIYLVNNGHHCRLCIYQLVDMLTIMALLWEDGASKTDNVQNKLLGSL